MVTNKIIIKIKPKTSVLNLFKNKSDGKVNIVIKKVLNPYKPVIDVICINLIFSDKEQANKFQGKPEKIEPLINSIRPNISEKTNILIKFLEFMKNLNIKNPIPKKKLINKGIKITVKGIKNLKLLSNDNEYDIQYKLDAKYPKPKVYP